MSGFPLQKPTDAAKYRQEYLANLRHRIKLDKINYDANQLYQRTGAPSQPTDTRGTEEKLADLHQLRIEVRQLLGQIADGDNANKIVQQLDDNQLRFVANQIEPISRELGQKYRLGVLADVFMPFLTRYMDDHQKAFQVITGASQGDSGTNLLRNQDEIMRTLITEQDVAQAIEYLEKMGLNNFPSGESILLGLRRIGNISPLVSAAFSALKTDRSASEKSQILESLDRLLDSVPPKNLVREAISVLTKLRAKGGFVSDDDLMDLLAITIGEGDIDSESTILENLISQSAPIEAYQVADLVFETPDGARFKYVDPDEMEVGRGPFDPMEYAKRLKATFPKVIKRTSFKSKIEARDYLKRMDGQLRKAMVEASTRKPPPQAVARPAPSSRMEGTGIGLVKRPRGRPVVEHKASNNLKPYDIDSSVPSIQPTPRFVPFGKYVINRHRLEKDVVAIKRPSGSPIIELPSRRVSRSLGTVLRGIAGGKLPTYDEIHKLDKEDQEYLHTLASKSLLLDKLSIPTPKKDADEQLISKFEVQRGQIFAGNDSKELVQDFKRTVVQMAHRQLLPKPQTRELLMMLADLGY